MFFDAPLDRLYLGANNEKTPPALITTQTDRDLRPRSPKEIIEDDVGAPSDSNAYSERNSYYASVNFHKAIGHLDRGEFNETQLELIRGHIRGAQARGLKVRYWETPFWPIGLRNHVWDVLVKEGVDFLNVDDLEAAAKREWGDWNGWWRKGKKTGQWR